MIASSSKRMEGNDGRRSQVASFINLMNEGETLLASLSALCTDQRFGTPKARSLVSCPRYRRYKMLQPQRAIPSALWVEDGSAVRSRWDQHTTKAITDHFLFRLHVHRQASAHAHTCTCTHACSSTICLMANADYCSKNTR